jgi:hypothetical protein
MDGDAGYAVPSGEALLRFASEVETDKLLDVRRVPFRGHVYNLQTDDGWYTANSIIVHNCQCVTVPVVIGVPNRFPLPTGQQIFNSKTNAEQDEMLGPEVAERVRAGDASLADLVEEFPLNTDQDPFITQAPVRAE